jgi:hypothetical protein
LEDKCVLVRVRTFVDSLVASDAAVDPWDRAEVVVDREFREPNLRDTQRAGDTIHQRQALEPPREARLLANPLVFEPFEQKLFVPGLFLIADPGLGRPGLDPFSKDPLIFPPGTPMIDGDHPYGDRQQGSRRDGKQQVQPLQVEEGIVGGTHTVFSFQFSVFSFQ